MKILIDTVNTDLYVSLIDENKTLAFGHLPAYKWKSDILPVVFKKLINEVSITAKDIDEIYVVNGPGSFMGVRAGLVFAKTMAMVTKAKLYSIDNLIYISGGTDGIYYIDAKGGKSYMGIITNGVSQIMMSDFKENSQLDYKDISANPSKYLNLFKLIENPMDLEALYIKKPRIGGK